MTPPLRPWPARRRAGAGAASASRGTLRALMALAVVAVAALAVAGCQPRGAGSGNATTAAPTWAKSFGGPGNDYGSMAIRTAEGGYLFVGARDGGPALAAGRANAFGADAWSDLWIVKLDALGDVQWERAHGENALGSARAGVRRSIAELQFADDGGYWLAGRESEGERIDTFVARLDRSGSVLWSRTFDVPDFPGVGQRLDDGLSAYAGSIVETIGDVTELVDRITPTRDGGLLIAATIAGHVRVSTGGGVAERRAASGIVVMKLAPSGERQWMRHFVAGPLGDESSRVTNLREAPDGTALVTTHQTLLRVDAGAVRWAVHDDTDGYRIDPSGAALLPLEYAGRTGAAAMEGILVGGTVDIDDWAIVADLGSIAPNLRRYGYDGTEQWTRTFEVADAGQLLAAQSACTRFAPRGASCNTVVLIDPNRIGGSARNLLLAQVIDTNGDDARVATALPGLRGVCDFRRDDAFLPDGRPSLRALVSDADGRLGTLVLDDLGAVRVPFAPLAAATRACGDTHETLPAPRLATDGRVARLENSPTDRDVREFVVTDASGAEQVRIAFREAAESTPQGRHLARAVIQTDDDSDGQADDGYVVALDAYDGPYGTRATAMLAKFDASGALSWVRDYPGLRLSFDYVDVSRRLLQTFEGSGATRRPTGFAFLATARADEGGELGVVLVRTNALGVVSGTSAFVKDGSNGANRAALAALADGGIVALADDVVARFAADGAVQWRRALATGDDYSALVVLSDGYAVAGGASNGPIVVRLAADGSVRWARRYPLVRDDRLSSYGPVALDAAPDGSLRVGATIGIELPEDQIGVFDDDRRFDLRVLALESDGTLRWDRQIGGRESDLLTSLEATPDGGVLIGATSASLGEAAEAWILRLGPDGRAGPGCAAAFADSVGLGRAQSVTLTAAPAAAPSRAVLAIGDRTAALASRPAAASTVVARQCSGVAQSPTSATDPPPPNTSELTVVQGGSITGVVFSVPNGILCGVAQNAGACTARFPNGMRVSLDIDPGSRSKFEGWTGCDAVVDRRCEVTIDRARSVTVRFADAPQADMVTFGIDAIGGRGRVSGTAGLNCAAGRLGAPACRVSVGRGSQLNVTATPDETRTFLGWGGACASFGTTRSILYVPAANTVCSANFSGPPAGAPNVAVELFPTLPPSGAIGYSYPGNVSSTPAGIDCGTRGVACIEGFVAGTNVRLTGDATLAGWEFERFDCTGVPGDDTSRSIDLGTLVGDVNCNAVFSQDVRRLTLRMLTDDAPRSPGNVFAIGGGLDCTASCDRSMARDRLVALRATPDAGHRFDSWQGCESLSPDPLGSARPPLCNVRLDQSREVIAFFSQPNNPGFNVVLAVGYTPGSTGGRATSQPLGAIDCTPQGGTCSAVYRVNDDVVLDIVPPAGGTVASQTGCDTFVPASGATPATCGFRMTADRVVTFGTTRPNAAPVAAFTFEPQAPLAGQPVTFDARASSDDVGIVTYRWDFTNNGSFDAVGALVSETFTAGAYTARLRVEDGDGAFAETTRAFTVVAPATRFPLTVSRGGSGVGTVIALQQGINCGSDCTEDYLAGSLVDLLVTPSGGSAFVSWQGCTQELPQPNGIPLCRVTMSGPVTIGVTLAAVGTQVPLTLRMQGSGDGVVVYTPSTTACSKSSEPTCVRSFATGTTVTLDATAYTGFRVGEWNGCDAVSQNGTRCSVTMNAARTVDVFLVP